MAEMTNFGSIDIDGKQVNIDNCSATELYDYQANLQKQQKAADKDIQDFISTLSKKLPEYKENGENYRKMFYKLQHTKNGVDHSLRLVEVAIFSKESEEQIRVTVEATRKHINSEAKKYGKAAVRVAKTETALDEFEDGNAPSVEEDIR